MSATPSSTGKDRPGRSAGSGSSSNGLSRGNGGKAASSSGANATVGPVTEPEEPKPENPVVADGAKDAATPPQGSSVVASASSGGSAAKAETPSSGAGTPQPGTPAVKDEQEPASPWSAAKEPSGSMVTEAAGGPGAPAAPSPAAAPFGAREAAPAAPGFAGGPGGAGPSSARPSMPGMSPPQSPGPGQVPGPQPGRSASLGDALKERVNDVMRPGRATAGGKSPRKAHLQVSRLEPWSVMKFSFVMSLVCFIVLLVAVAVIYMILSGLGVFDQIVQTINELTQDKNAANNTFDAASWFSFTRIFGYTALVGALNVLLITALATVWSVIYNIAADFVGGIEVTLKEAE